MLFGIVTVLAIYIAQVVYWHEKITEAGLCTYHDLFTSSLFSRLYDEYALTRIFLSGSIDLWIAVMTIIVLRLLQKETEVTAKPAFRKEICKIKVIYWTFVLTYTSWFLYEALIVIDPLILSTRTRFVDEIIDNAIMIVFVYVPISVVLCAHFLSYSSVSRLLKIV